jgi:hypothetical protein
MGENFDIFISYRRSDGEHIARAITETLKGENYRCFLDFDKLKGGKFDERIEAAIKDAPIFIAVMTPHYLVRPEEEKTSETEKEDWVYKEIEYAIENKKYFVVINYNKKIKDIPEKVPSNISQGLGAHQFAEVYDGQTYESNMKALIKDWISPVVPPPSKRTYERANIEVYSDCDCNIFKAGEVIATVPEGGCSVIKLKQGRHLIICQSSEFPDIEQKVIKEVSKELADDFIEIKLVDKVKQRQIVIAEKRKAEKAEAERKRKAEAARIAAEKAENERIEKEKQLAEQRLKAEQAHLEAERRRQEELKKEKEARIQRKRERERQRKEAAERRRSEQSKENKEKTNTSYRKIGYGFLILCVLILIICVSTCKDFGLATETPTETITETPIEVIEIPLDYDENRLPKIYSIEIKNESYAGELITGYGEKIYSTKTMILKPKISYKSYANRDYKFYIKWIKPDGTIRRTNFSPAGYSQSKSCKLSYGEGTTELAGWGSKTKGYWKEGNYAIEIWCEGTLLKRKEFTIYKSK